MLMTASARGFSSTSATLLQHAIGIYEGEYGRRALTIRFAALLHLDEVLYDVIYMLKPAVHAADTGRANHVFAIPSIYH